MVISLSQLVNQYGTYSGTTLIGELGSRATVPNATWNGVTPTRFRNIDFIIQFYDGSQYASSNWINARKNGNPYIHQNSVAKLGLKINLPSVNRVELGTDLVSEEYSEMKSTVYMASDKTKLLEYISWLCDDSPGAAEVLPVSSLGTYGAKPSPVGIPGTFDSPLVESIENGEFELVGIDISTLTYRVGVRTSFGGTYNPELDLRGQYPGMKFNPTRYDGSVEGQRAINVTIPKPPPPPPAPVEVEADIVEEIIEPIIIEPIELEPIDIEIEPIEGIYFDYDKFQDGFDFGVGNLNPITNNNVFGDTGINTGGLDSLMAIGNEGGLASIGSNYATEGGNQPMQFALGQNNLDKLNLFGSGFGAFG